MPSPSMIAMLDEAEESKEITTGVINAESLFVTPITAKNIVANVIDFPNEDGGADLTRPFYYLAGKMSGLPGFGFPVFDRYARILRERHLNICNPAELGYERERKAALENETGRHMDTRHPDAPTWEECLRRDLRLVLRDECIGIICIPGWEKSAGARLETFVVASLGRPIFLMDVGGEKESVILTEIDRWDAVEAAGQTDRIKPSY